jgi:hypothetical protein
MEFFEALGYVVIFGYMAFGLGYFMRKGLTEVYFSPEEADIPVIGIHETTTVNIDHLFDENEIPQIDRAPE